jgi:hypothetical protein
MNSSRVSTWPRALPWRSCKSFTVSERMAIGKKHGGAVGGTTGWGQRRTMLPTAGLRADDADNAGGSRALRADYEVL